MSSIVPRATSSLTTNLSTARTTNRALARVEERTLIRSAEIQAVAYLGQTALNSVAQVSLAQASLEAIVPESARLRLAAIGDATTAAIQMRIIDLMNGL